MRKPFDKTWKDYETKWCVMILLPRMVNFKFPGLQLTRNITSFSQYEELGFS